MGFDSATLMNFLPMVLLLGFAYFMLLRPQQKQQKKTKSMLEAMKVGDEVMTAGGFYGIIYAIDDTNVVLEMLPDYNKAMIRKASIVQVITADQEEEVEEVEADEVIEAGEATAEEGKSEAVEAEVVQDDEVKAE